MNLRVLRRRLQYAPLLDDLEYRVSGFGFRVSGLGFRVRDASISAKEDIFRFRVSVSVSFRVSVQGFGLRVFQA